ncbi:UNVERIFIED_CONTAM: LINE-1 retrotransposable element O protein [Sesamum radiatum]|uniref:LINE-1 retrotransposable element O protein n=1 Tax=Sesamum radiatum TaxID=300843 RepID=A0AAW2JKY8_SESRA
MKKGKDSPLLLFRVTLLLRGCWPYQISWLDRWGVVTALAPVGLGRSCWVQVLDFSPASSLFRLALAMFSDLDRLGDTLTLTEEKDAGWVLPTSLWHVEPLAHGDRVLGRYPWAYEKNWLVLAPVKASDDPNLVDLDWCDFHIHIHGLPLGKMTKEIAAFIGNKSGSFKEVDLDSNGEVWGSSVRVRVAIDITKPLKHALKIRTVLGDDHLITFSLGLLIRERIPILVTGYGSQLPSIYSGVVAHPHPVIVSLSPTALCSLLIAPFNLNGLPQRVEVLPSSAPLRHLVDENLDDEVVSQGRCKLRNFKDALSNCDVHDIGFSGDPFTWCNRHASPSTVYERLDRACANMDWSQLFPEALVSHLPMSRSDHKALLIKLKDCQRVPPRLSRPWRFEAAWLQLEHCERVVADSWVGWGGRASSEGISAQLEACQHNLYRWSKAVIRADRQRSQALETRLKWLLAQPITPVVQLEIGKRREELESGAAREETKWRQRSKDMWLREGDRNTSFFHRRASQRYCTNLICQIRTESGVWVESEEDIRRCISSHFQGVYTSSRPRQEDIDKGTEGLRRLMDAKMSRDLLQPYTAEEVTKALFQMAPLKSPGPDGMSPLFFQKFWHIVRPDVTRCVLNLLNSFIMPPGMNSTHIVLIPKCKHPEYLSQFRAISSCNIVYKIASKAIANKLKLFLDKIISPAQSTFVSGRFITDNILLAFELNNFLSTSDRGWMALKLDVNKACDKVEWSFLEQLVERDGRLQGVSICRSAPSISHLLFADDTLIFCRASLVHSRTVREVFEVYRLALGQEINFSKSSVAFSRNTKEDVCCNIMADLSIRRENKMELYLGLPSRVARSKRELFATIREKVWSRISGWNEKILSQVGREVLIKFVVQAIPTYAMGCFRLPLSLLKEIQSMIARFWWNNGGQNKIHWVSWKRLCNSKLIVGMRFRQLHLFNLAMLAKHWWRLLCFPERLLSLVLRAKYFPHGDIFSATLSSCPSFTWRSLMAAHELFRAGCRWRIGSGSDLSPWAVPWLPRALSFKSITPAPMPPS